MLALRLPIPLQFAHFAVVMRLEEIRVTRKIPYGVIMVTARLAVMALRPAVRPADTFRRSGNVGDLPSVSLWLAHGPSALTRGSMQTPPRTPPTPPTSRQAPRTGVDELQALIFPRVAAR